MACVQCALDTPPNAHTAPSARELCTRGSATPGQSLWGPHPPGPTLPCCLHRPPTLHPEARSHLPPLWTVNISTVPMPGLMFSERHAAEAVEAAMCSQEGPHGELQEDRGQEPSPQQEEPSSCRAEDAEGRAAWGGSEEMAGPHARRDLRAPGSQHTDQGQLELDQSCKRLRLQGSAQGGGVLGGLDSPASSP